MATHSSILVWDSHGQRSLAGYSAWGCKKSDMNIYFFPQVTAVGFWSWLIQALEN